MKRPKTPMNGAHAALDEDALLLREGEKIVRALGRMFAPACEVVLHDLKNPHSAILAIENPLSGRKVGQATTEMGLARVRDPGFPDIVQNYPNDLPDGRHAKSTSIGLRNSQGVCVVAICLNLDLSLFDTVQKVIGQLSHVDPIGAPVKESFRSGSRGDVRDAVQAFAAALNTQPKALTTQQRRDLMKELSDNGFFKLRGAASQVGEILGMARSSVYNAIRAGGDGADPIA